MCQVEEVFLKAQFILIIGSHPHHHPSRGGKLGAMPS